MKHSEILRKIASAAIVLFALLLLTTVGGSYYMLDYALAPHPERQDTARRFARLREEYPETGPWLDSLRSVRAFKDTFVVMPTGEKHHAYIIRRQPQGGKTAIAVHGWREQGIAMLMIARLYERMGYNVVVPDLHAHGLSEGDAVGMGWREREDVLQWMTLFRADTMVVHGISMGAATAMNVSGEKMPEGVRDMRFVEDCGYTSVWDEFRYELKAEFGLPAFPLLHTASLLCRLHYGWNFQEAAPVRLMARCSYPMLLIHGDNDGFVPSWMVHPLYEAKPGPKQLWVTEGSHHAASYRDYPEVYAARLKCFLLPDNPRSRTRTHTASGAGR